VLKNKRIIFLLRVLFHVFLGVVLGGSLVMFYVSSNGTLQHYIEERLQHKFQEKYNCRLECQLDKINWLSLRMFFSQVHIKPFGSDQDIIQDGEKWSISADSFILSCSWWSLLTALCFKVSGEFEHMVMQEAFEKKASGLSNFIKKLFVKDKADIFVYDCMSISDGVLLISQEEEGVSVQLPYTCNMSCEVGSTRMQFYAKDGLLSYNKNTILNDISGSLVWDIPENDIVKNMYMQIHMGMHVVPLAQKGACFLVGSMNNGLGSFLLKNEEQSFKIDPIQIRADSKKCLFDVSVFTSSDLCKQLDLHEVSQDIHGMLQIDCRGDLYDFFKTLLIDVSIEDVAYKNKKLLKDGKIFVQYKKSGILYGQIATEDKSWFEFTMSSNNKGLIFEFFNEKDFVLLPDSHWRIASNKCHITVNSDQERGWHGLYQVEISNAKLQEKKSLEGTFKVYNNVFSLQGSIDDISYDIVIPLEPELFLKKAIFTQNDKTLVDFYADEQDNLRLRGMIDFCCIKSIVSDSLKSSFSQEGAINFQGYIQNGIYYSQVSTKQANIRVPKVYNVIQDVEAACEVDFYNRSIQLKDVKAELHEGEVVCSQANFYFNRSGSCYFMHVPLLLHNVLLSWDKGIFMLLSGGLYLQKSYDKNLQLSGQIIVEKSQLKENIFSSEFQEKLFGRVLEFNDKDGIGMNCDLDVSIFTKDLLHITTSFLSAKARLDLELKGSLIKPELSGMAQLTSGSFFFPYKPLEILDGKIFFVPEQQLDPLIEVLARGKLKRFGVTMRVAGSVFDPYVLFESVPYLTEEQIMSLLLLGIEDSSLSVMFPALLMQKFKDIVVGSDHSKSALQSRFNLLRDSLKYFRFLPQITSQTGRGGMRGVFEIDASDHLHGKVDTNFMHLEDTKFDVDFALTDDITFRVQKDGPSTYGGEIELRWKFN